MHLNHFSGQTSDIDMDSVARTIANDVYEQLRHDIISCRMPPGSKINIKALVQKYEVSLGAVREALSKLSAEGLV
ncbi:MAG: GntR family transcriptional regulator, partial [Mesorhizobium sp.]